MRGVFSFFIVFFFSFLYAQKGEYWLIDVDTQKKTLVRDSLSATRYLDSLAQNRFYLLQLKRVEQGSDGIHIFYDKGTDFSRARVYFSEALRKELNLTDGEIVKNIDSLKTSINEFYNAKGFVFNRVKTKFHGMDNHIPKIKISVEPTEMRKINGFIPKGYEKIPERFMKNLSRQYIGKPYTEQTLLSIQRDLQYHQLITLKQPPQTLFTKDSTQIFLFLDKKKVNIFDAMLGFANDELGKVNFSGTVNLQFKNVFNSFESLGIHWQRTPEKAQSIDALVAFPYLFKSNIGIDFQLNIFRKDTDFANVKVNPMLLYTITNQQRIGLKGSVELSTNLNEQNTISKDYSKQGIGLSYFYTQPSNVELFSHKTFFTVEGQYFNTYYENEDLSARQFKLFLKAENNFHIIGNHWINTRLEGGMLHSNQKFAFNELFRFGGWNSLRGFNENLLTAQHYYFGTAEYRYLIENQAFFDVFGQYGQMKNTILSIQPTLYSFGLGFHFTLPIGLMSFQISNGTTTNQSIRFSDTKIHWGIVTKF